MDQFLKRTGEVIRGEREKGNKQMLSYLKQSLLLNRKTAHHQDELETSTPTKKLAATFAAVSMETNQDSKAADTNTGEAKIPDMANIQDMAEIYDTDQEGKLNTYMEIGSYPSPSYPKAEEVQRVWVFDCPCNKDFEAKGARTVDGYDQSKVYKCCGAFVRFGVPKGQQRDGDGNFHWDIQIYHDPAKSSHNTDDGMGLPLILKDKYRTKTKADN
ncbi:MAG: hypothetical protein SGILL_006338 [Bacillariaceae sp.]